MHDNDTHKRQEISKQMYRCRQYVFALLKAVDKNAVCCRENREEDLSSLIIRNTAQYAWHVTAVLHLFPDMILCA